MLDIKTLVVRLAIFQRECSHIYVNSKVNENYLVLDIQGKQKVGKLTYCKACPIHTHIYASRINANSEVPSLVFSNKIRY